MEGSLWPCTSSWNVLLVTFAIVIAVLAAGNPLALFAKATASIGSSAALTSNEIALFNIARYQTESEISKPAAEALFKQFQVWAAAEDAGTRVQQPEPPGKELGARVVKHARAEVRPPQTQRYIRPAHAARGDVRLPKQARRKVRHPQYALAYDWLAPIGWSERYFGW